MCFVWISEKEIIISIYRIDGLVFILLSNVVYCAVGTRNLVLNLIQFNLSL